MKLSLNWIQDFVNINIPVEELADKLSKSSTEIKQILNQEEQYAGVVVGEILEINPHPNARKLKVAKVTDGKKKYDVVCGAGNIKVGQKVPLELTGSIIPNTWRTKKEITLEKTDIRGFVSEAMMCSERELDLGDDHTGIYILPESAVVGEKVSKVLELDDTILDADFLTNQGFCMSHLGLAREISALINEPVRPHHSEVSLPMESDEDNELEVVIEDARLCPRYTAIVLEGIKVEASSDWMQRRLKAAGMRPVNNVVDTTNYVMLEMGQPMHAFDYDKIAKKDGMPTIIVRTSQAGEEIETLDEKQRELPEGVLLIADDKKPIAIAGIVGGANTEIDDNTTKIVLESANFDAITLRKATRKLAIRTDAVSRFEKTIDPNLTMSALKRVVEILLEITNGKVVSKVVDEYPKELKEWHINLRPEKVNRVLGIEIDRELQKDILKRLGFKVDDQGEHFLVTIPTRRRDIKRDVDLIEEIIRIYGYDNIPLDWPESEQKPAPLNPKIEFVRKMRNLMVGLGFNDLQTYSFTGEEMIENCQIEVGGHIKLLNPQSPEREYMRKSLLPEILEVAANNLKIEDESRLFEVQKVYFKNHDFDSEDKVNTYAQEPEQLSLVWSREGLDYYNVKGLIEALMKHLQYENVEYIENDGKHVAANTFHPNKSANVIINGENAGIIGELHPQVIKNLGIGLSTVAFELSVPELMEQLSEKAYFEDYSKYQPTEQELSFILDRSVRTRDIHEQILKASSGLVKEVEAFDYYVGEGIPEGKKAVGFKVVLQSDDHTLSAEEIDEARENIVKAVEKKFGAKIRS